jgi:hypothetical protein
MPKVTQYSRISHHTIAGSASAGLTFSVPAQEDFTDGSWTPYDLALSEIGVNEEDKKVYIRIDDQILELGTIGGSSSLGITPSWGQVLSVGNTSDGNNIIMNSGGQILGGTGEILSILSDYDVYLERTDGLTTQSVEIGTPFGATNSIDIKNINIITNDFSQQIFTTKSSLLKVDDSVNGFVNQIFMEPSVGGIELKNDDGINFQNIIIISTQSTLIDTQDFTTQKQGKLEVHRDFCYFGHFDGIAGYLSAVQVQDYTILLQTQDGNVLHQINMDSSNLLIPFSLKTDDGVNASQITLKPDSIKIDGAGVIEIEVGAQTINFSKNNNNLTYDFGGNGTTNATPIIIGTIDFSGVIDKVITVTANINGIGSIVNLAYGAKLFAAFKNIGGTITQLSTTDKSEKTDFTTATSDIIISGTDIVIQVTGELATAINWETDFSYHIS